ncbi:MAG: 50S ribosomal protein L24 [Patescibacteria group bacterium]
MKLKKDDKVKIITGKDKNKAGKVLKVFPKERRILIEGLNIYKKHARPKKQGEKGQVITVSRPINASNVMLICPSCGKSSRTGLLFEQNKKFRICKKCRAKI